MDIVAQRVRNPVRPISTLRWIGVITVFGIAFTLYASQSASGLERPPLLHLRSSYAMHYDNLTANAKSTGELEHVKQDPGGGLTGIMVVNPPLGGGGPFTGRLSGLVVTISIQSTGATYTGTVNASGVIKGTYVYPGQDGIWTADPLGSPFVQPPGRSNRTSTVATTLPTPRQAFHSVVRTVVNAAIAGGGVLFITFPAQMFNDTLDENYEELLAMLRSFVWQFGGKRRKAKKQKRIATAESKGNSTKKELVVFSTVLVLGSLIGGYRDPSFGLNVASVATFIGTVLALCGLIAAPATAAVIYRRLRKKRTEFSLRAIPAGLAIAFLSVIVSRLTGFQPGYLYGLVCGIAFAHKLGKQEEGYVVALESLATLVASFLCWIAFVPVDRVALRPGSGFGVALLDDLLASVVVGGVIGIAIGLLPLRFLPGGTLYKWNRAIWAVLILIAMFGVVAIMLNPSSAPVNQGATPIVTVAILFAVFGGLSVAFRQYFASRRSSDDPESRVTAPTGTARAG